MEAAGTLQELDNMGLPKGERGWLNKRNARFGRKTKTCTREGDNKFQDEEDDGDDGNGCSKFKCSKSVLWIQGPLHKYIYIIKQVYE